MYSKEQVIHKIGEERWDAFEIFILGREVDYDDYGFEIYYPNDVAEFCDNHNII